MQVWGSTVVILYKLISVLHADGQKIAKRLASQITKEMKKITSLLDEYNRVESSLQHNRQSLPDVLNPTSEFWLSLDQMIIHLLLG